MPPLQQSSIGLALLCLLMTGLWLLQRRTRDAGIVDVAWSGGLGAMAIFIALTADGDPTRRLLLGAVAGFWGFRLAGFLLFGRILGGSEDARYATLRRSWGDRADRNFFLFFQFQALLVMGLAVPFQVAAFSSAPAPALHDWVGVAVGLMSVAGETLADRQLAAFRNDPENRGKTCRKGLWRYSRHPNYFFEWLHWWAYAALGWGTGWWFLTLTAPALMLFLLYKVTGIPATEARALASRGDEYRRYQETTSAFFPWFPKEGRR